ncbi:MAG: DUF2723 domain-containing protein [Ignavibacteria bacterium]|nr:DUF2723 domain-containing protein [Ignavibacteria bacterium]
MNHKIIHRAVAACVFLITAVVYLMTVQPNVSFWDCGEFISSAYYLQVPHPPGTPFFLILGRLFSMLPIGDNVAFRVNLVSVISSAFTVLFLYLTAVKIIQFYKKDNPKGLLDNAATYIAAAIGALSLAFSDTFWFNAVEAEVYALATFFIAFVVWIMMVWNEKADEPDNEKYLIFIAYLIGLSTGVHLMSVLAIVPIMMTIMYRKYFTDDKALKVSGYVFLAHAAVIIIISLIMWSSQTDGPSSREAYYAFDSRFKWFAGMVSLVFMLIFFKKVFNWNSIYLPMIFGAIALFGTYPGIVKYLPELLYSLSGNSSTAAIAVIALLLGLLAYAIYYTHKKEMNTLNLIAKCILFAILGFSSYTSIIIRSNLDTPINLNSPKTVSALVKYLNREQYGDFPIFKRRFTNEPHQQGVFTNYSSDLDFLYRYQMDHMFNRYLMWNYVGRESTEQDCGVNVAPFNGFFNSINSALNLKYQFKGDIGNSLLGIPFLIGLLGLYFHFRKDWKIASVFLVMFIFLGYLTAFYQNQQEPQPRERDYFYVGAFFVFSIWIALGVRGIIDIFVEKFAGKSHQKISIAGVLVLGVALIPANMLAVNYFEHDRSRNYIPWDYSYNILQSAAPNAIIFTNGDNDTFPLWYLQDVEGVRRDVRIANLSLLNTDWYIKQLKNTAPYGSQKIKMTYSDFEIDNISNTGYIPWTPKAVAVDVPKNIINEFNVTDSSVTSKGKLEWYLPDYAGMKVLRIQDAMVKSIIDANKWERPIYFAVTCSDDSRIGLDEYMRMEGLAFRFVPQKAPANKEYMDEDLMYKFLFNEPKGYSKDYQPGFKFRGLNDPTIFFDENHVRMCQNYRNSYLRLALRYYNNIIDSQKVISILDKMEEKMPRRIISMDVRLKFDISELYYNAGAHKQYNELANEIIAELEPLLAKGIGEVNSRYTPFRMLWATYDYLGSYDKSLGLLYKLEELNPGSNEIKAYINAYKSKIAQRDSQLAKSGLTK